MEFDIKLDPEGISVKPMTRTLLVPESVINLQFIERWPTPDLHELERESLQQTELVGGAFPGNVREHAADHVRADLQAKALSVCYFVWGRWRGDRQVMDGQWQLINQGSWVAPNECCFFHQSLSSIFTLRPRASRWSCSVWSTDSLQVTRKMSQTMSCFAVMWLW